MTKYKIIYTDTFFIELDSLIDVILYQYKAPLTAKRYLEGLRKEIKYLELIAGSLPYCRNKSVVDKFGTNFKRLNYKKVSILFYVDGQNVYLISILPQSGIYGV